MYQHSPDLSPRSLYTLYQCQVALKDCPDSSAEERWSHIHDAIYNSAMATFGKREKKNPDWFEAGITELDQTTEQPSQSNVQLC